MKNVNDAFVRDCRAIIHMEGHNTQGIVLSGNNRAEEAIYLA
jgi:hypothetical protein